MSNLLVIKAHPLSAEHSTSMKVMDHFISSFKASNPDASVEIVDVFTSDIPELDEALLTAMYSLKAGNDFATLTTEQQGLLTRFNASTEQFLAADRIVIANALWNLNIPTRLKAWVDTINVAGKTFKYTATGPAPLTEGKKVLHIQSNGGSYNGQDFSSMYLKGIMNFVGVNDYHQLFIEGIDHHPEDSDKILAAAFASAADLAKTF
ncbi:FMN-dependent NADH-azoreductase [Vagococcus intermedius]|uniref:FMN dependent NADH:quinone oxidoreductase n=1 Tax=Vagococcus intermedius TaxID=2991418 RepID=A0AAF0CTV0_9ENTE|nr:NAD(P)H-dependent oxidoreductase [Vagococcus intermedius]WEG72880.1 NAD(P)H-dependent oxidoreductase [Vagococcus intermedius]WEG74967.1 NAD(P)H-dependent oxidoreductase [Vagococcus intermedius]